jgi:integrase
MPEKRVTVWVQRFKDRPHLMLQWIDPDTGRRKSKSAETADEKEAEARRVDLEADLNNDRYQEASRMTWERFRELFEAEYVAGQRENTRLNQQATLNLFERICNPKTLRGITERTLSLFVAGMRKAPGRRLGTTGMMASTIKTRLQFLHVALGWAVGQKLLARVPTFPEVKVPRKKPRPVPTEAFEKLLDKAPDAMMRAYLLTGWLAGLRRGEAFDLEWEETRAAPYLDLERNRIVLPAEYVKAVEDQWVTLDPHLREVLEALPQQGRKVFPFVGPGGARIVASSVGDRVRRLARKAGVKLTMHSLRKGFGCYHAAKVPAQVLQKLMRHGDIKTTMDYYANVDAAAEQAILSRECNSLRNSQTVAADGSATADEANSSPETDNAAS